MFDVSFLFCSPVSEFNTLGAQALGAEEGADRVPYEQDDPALERATRQRLRMLCDPER